MGAWDKLGNFVSKIVSHSEEKEKAICKMGFWKEDNWVWDVRWRREAFKWEKVLIKNFNLVLNSIQVCKHTTDTWFWKFCSIEEYSTNSAYGILSQDGGLDSSNEIFSLV